MGASRRDPLKGLFSILLRARFPSDRVPFAILCQISHFTSKQKTSNPGLPASI
ncbi:MAG: hypothetical protein [Siphoviridae sp. ctpQM7]|nr:MAG: hypothetical protein [Siphoviridae sp. ctpQM7]